MTVVKVARPERTAAKQFRAGDTLQKISSKEIYVVRKAEEKLYLVKLGGTQAYHESGCIPEFYEVLPAGTRIELEV